MHSKLRFGEGLIHSAKIQPGVFRMKSTALVLCFAASFAAIAQTAAKPATTPTKQSAPASKPSAAGTASAGPAVVKYPEGKKADPAIKKTLLALRRTDM